jgi:hypothetical protein
MRFRHGSCRYVRRSLTPPLTAFSFPLPVEMQSILCGTFVPKESFFSRGRYTAPAWV